MSLRLMISLAVLLPALATGGGLGCGGAAPTSATPGQTDSTGSESSGSRAAARPGGEGEKLSVMGEVGALDRPEVEKTFAAAMPAVDRCLEAARKRVRGLGGDIELFLQVDGMGKAVVAKLVRSTLGDREVDGCILGVYRGRTWPRPVGGKVGEIRQTYRFAAPGDRDAPAEWSFETLARAMDRDASAGAQAASTELLAKLGQCKSDAKLEHLDVIFYLDQEGFAQAVGVSIGGGDDRDVHDCVSTVIKTTSFPSPGDSPAKVTVSVR